MKNQQLDCAQFVLKVGLDSALKIFGEQVWDKAKLTFDQWGFLYLGFGGNQDLSAKILAKMMQTASTSDNWLKVWSFTPADSSLCPLIIEKIKEELKTLTTFDQVQRWRPMAFQLDFKRGHNELNAVWVQRLAEVAASTWEWSIVRDEARNSRVGNNDLAAKALTKMVDCATRTGTAEDWNRVYHETPAGSHTKQALAYFVNQDNTFEEWYGVWYRAREKDDSDLAKSAWQKVVASASNFEEWRSIFWKDEENDAVTKELCANKVRKLAKTFRDWYSIYTSNDIDSGMKADALTQMLARAETLDDWYNVWYWTPDGCVEKARALEEVRSFVKLD